MSNNKSRHRRPKTQSGPDAALMKAFNALDEDAKPYCAHLLCSGIDVINALSTLGDPVGVLRKFDPELAEEAGIIRRVKSVSGRLSNDAKRLRRWRMSWTEMQDAAVAVLDSSVPMTPDGKKVESLVDVILKLSDIIEALTLAMNTRLNVRSADRLNELFELNGATSGKRPQLMALWRDLEDFCQFEAELNRDALEGNEFVEVPYEAADSEAILDSVKGLTRDEQIFCSYLQNSLVAALMYKTGDRITMFEEKLQELEVEEEEADLILEQVSECADADGKMPPLDKLGKPIRAGYSVAELAGKALMTMRDRFVQAEEEGEPMPLRDAFATLYTALVYIYETNEVDLDAKVMRDSDLSESVRYAIKCTKFLLGVIPPPTLTVKPEQEFDATGVLDHLKKTLSPGEFGMTACGIQAVSETFKAIFSKRQLTRDVESHLLLRNRGYFKRLLDNVWPIHHLADEWRIFGEEPDTKAMQAMLPKGPTTMEQVHARLMPYAAKVADAVMTLPVERRSVSIAITCHNDLIRTLGRMDGNEKLEVLLEAADTEELVQLYDITSVFLSLVSHCLHKHPDFSEA